MASGPRSPRALRSARRSSCCRQPIRRRASDSSPPPASSPTRARGTCASPLSSITCRTTMSQRSSSSPRTAVTEDESLLSQVPRDRRPFTRTDSWRLLRIMGEFVEGFDTLSDVYNAVTVFGSARTPADDPYYVHAVETARMLALEGFPLITGGGPG